MERVETVLGPIEAGELGTTLIHEHLRVWDEAVHNQWPNAGTAKEDPPYAVGADEEYAVGVRDAKAAVELGVKTICDPAAMFLGRDVRFMRRVSEESGLQVVPCTGIYTYDYLPQFLLTRDADQIADLFVADIEEGIQGTEIKAAFIKVAADEPGVTENIEKVHRAAARASLRTGAPIMAHTRPASNTGPRQIEIFEEEGVELSKVQLAHTGDTDDLGYIEGVLDKGVWIGLDRYGLDLFLPYDRRQATAKALLERGYADRVFLSADSCATLDYYPVNVLEQLLEAGAAQDWNIRTVPEKVLPELRQSGMTEEQERTIMVDNPVRWLSGHQAAPSGSEGRSL
jgi:phosphotriesterase-related protein